MKRDNSQHPESNSDTNDSPNLSAKPPGLIKQAWSVSVAMAHFVADGFKTTTKEQYKERLEICDGCEMRTDNRCAKCGCSLAFKAKGRAFKCPLDKWPKIGN